MMACPECRGKGRHKPGCHLLEEQFQEIIDRALPRAEQYTVDGHPGGHCRCALELLEAQEQLAAAREAARLVIDCPNHWCGSLCMDCVAALVRARGETDS